MQLRPHHDHRPPQLNAIVRSTRDSAAAPVLHYTQLLLELVESGALTPPPAPQVVTYHDPCYLGRYNHGFDAPRRIIERLATSSTRCLGVVRTGSVRRPRRPHLEG